MVRAGEPDAPFWFCNLAAALVGVGLLVPWPRLAGVGTLWLLVGTPVWLAGVLAGSVLHGTALLTHAGALVLGAWGLRSVGLPRGTWRWSLAGHGVLLVASRLLAPPETNLNLAFATWEGWEHVYPSHAAFLAVLGCIDAASAFAGERVLRRWWARPGP